MRVWKVVAAVFCILLLASGVALGAGCGCVTSMNVKQCCGAVGDGVVDDTNSILMAANMGSGAVYLPAGTYKTTSALPMRSGLHYWGSGIGTIIKGANASANLFEGPTTGQLTWAGIHSMQMQGVFNNAIYMPVPVGGNPSTYITLDDLNIAMGTGAGIYFENQSEEWRVNNVKIQGGQYGIRYNHPTVGTVDKSTFINVDTTGQSINGWRMEVFLSTSVTIINPIVIHDTQHGMYFDGSIDGLTIINMNTEYNGYNQPNVITTGSINAGSPTLTVASATGLSIGQTLTIKGAGNDFSDFVEVIDNIVGTTVTMHTNAVKTVSSAEVTNALWSDIYFNNTIATPRHTRIIGGTIGVNHPTLASIRYSIDAQRASDVMVMGAATSRPINDPGVNVAAFGPNAVEEIRQGNIAAGFDAFGSGGLGYKNGPRTLIPSPLGTDIHAVLRDSNGAGTGTYGEFDIKKWDSNRTRIFRVLGSDGSTFVSGPLETFSNLKMGSYLEGPEIADPAAPATNNGRLYFKDNGAGKTQLVVRFPTGAVQVIATEP
jgi:hypothetical protein